ncbi:hypothetical protein LAZ67_17001787 [Cordylochernes scorpioides]|uniref:CCHC-type domain-containing protein n=1 Tax=Cordylochernes scorpioides TaxID=51811 RepID=A0ABY6LDW7_9ARAC|nr:hypothetical protein LAZ67_17001787 [Cordylochernes scorpioides]
MLGFHRRAKAKTSLEDDDVPIDDTTTKPLFTPQENGRKGTRDKVPRLRWNLWQKHVKSTFRAYVEEKVCSKRYHNLDQLKSVLVRAMKEIPLEKLEAADQAEQTHHELAAAAQAGQTRLGSIPRAASRGRKERLGVSHEQRLVDGENVLEYPTSSVSWTERTSWSILRAASRGRRERLGVSHEQRLVDGENVLEYPTSSVSWTERTSWTIPRAASRGRKERLGVSHEQRLVDGKNVLEYPTSSVSWTERTSWTIPRAASRGRKERLGVSHEQRLVDGKNVLDIAQRATKWKPSQTSDGVDTRAGRDRFKGNMEEMDAIKKRRKAIRGTFTRIINEIKGEFEKSQIDRNDIYSKFNRLESYYTKLVDLNEKYQALLVVKEGITEESIDREWQECDKYEEEKFDIQQKVSVLRNPDKEETIPIASEDTVINVKLPELALKSYDGSLEGWLPWWAQFSKIHENKNLSDSDRFLYLRQAIVPNSEAYRVVASYPVTGANYVLAVQALQERFGDPNILTELYVRRLLNSVISNVKKENRNLSSLYDELSSHLRSLETLGIDPQLSGIFLYPLVESSLPSDILKIWHRHPSSGYGMELAKREEADKGVGGAQERLRLLLDFLKAEVRSAQRLKFVEKGFKQEELACRVAEEELACRVAEEELACRVQRNAEEVLACRVAEEVLACRVAEEELACRVAEEELACRVAEEELACRVAEEELACRVQRKFKGVQKAAIEIMDRAKMDLREWEYSLEENPEKGTCTKILGVVWNKMKDSLKCELPDNLSLQPKLTKRLVLSMVQRIFDPLGFCAPVFLPPKLLLQRSGGLKLGWDTPLPESMAQEFRTWLDQIKLIELIKIPRYMWNDLIFPTEVHIFCDASQIGYGAVAYLRSETGRENTLTLIWSKVRLAPMKSITIPRLELMAMVLGARLANAIQAALKRKCETTLWSDSTTALSWIKREIEWRVFVRNRVREIQATTNLNDWRFVPSQLNPADLLSRGCPPSQFVQSRWWEGPEWLKKPKEFWPNSEFSINPKEINVEENIMKTNINLNIDYKDWILTRRSNYSLNIRVMSYVLRFLGKLKKQSTETGPLKVSEPELKQRFLKEYLGALIQKSENIDRRQMFWPKGRIVNLIPGKDGIVRVAHVKTSTGTLIRALQRLHPLEISSNVETIQKDNSNTEPQSEAFLGNRPNTESRDSRNRYGRLEAADQAEQTHHELAAAAQAGQTRLGSIPRAASRGRKERLGVSHEQRLVDGENVLEYPTSSVSWTERTSWSILRAASRGRRERLGVSHEQRLVDGENVLEYPTSSVSWTERTSWTIPRAASRGRKERLGVSHEQRLVDGKNVLEYPTSSVSWTERTSWTIPRAASRGRKERLGVSHEQRLVDGKNVLDIAQRATKWKPSQTSDGVDTRGDWPKWIRRFKRFRQASGLINNPENEQVNMLVYMGDNADDILLSCKIASDQLENYNKVIECFESHFIPRRNIIYERARFNQRCQQEGEKVNEFITALHSLAEHCNFGMLHDELIRDRIVVGVRDRALSERMQLDTDLTLVKATLMAKQLESVKEQQSSLYQQDSVDQIKKMPNHIKETKRHEPKIRQFKSNQLGGSSHGCTRCGNSNNHAWKNCPAMNSYCSKCKKKGHYAKVCRSEAINEIKSAIAFLGSVEDNSKKWIVPIKVNNKQINFKIDTGADVNVLPLQYYYQSFQRIKLEKSDKILQGPNGIPLETVGMIHFGGTTAKIGTIQRRSAWPLRYQFGVRRYNYYNRNDTEKISMTPVIPVRRYNYYNRNDTEKISMTPVIQVRRYNYYNRNDTEKISMTPVIPVRRYNYYNRNDTEKISTTPVIPVRRYNYYNRKDTEKISMAPVIPVRRYNYHNRNDTEKISMTPVIPVRRYKYYNRKDTEKISMAPVIPVRRYNC